MARQVSENRVLRVATRAGTSGNVSGRQPPPEPSLQDINNAQKPTYNRRSVAHRAATLRATKAGARRERFIPHRMTASSRARLGKDLAKYALRVHYHIRRT